MRQGYDRLPVDESRRELDALAGESSQARNEGSSGIVSRRASGYKYRIDTKDEPDYFSQLENLPTWIVPEAVRSLVETQRRKTNGPVPLGMTAGHAIPLALVSALLLWSFYVYFTPIIASVAKCQSSGYATYPLWIWLVFLPTLTSALVLEVMCFRDVVVPKYQVLRDWKIFCCSIPFKLWLVYAVGMSTLAYTEFATVSAFTGTMWSTAQCDFGQFISKQWDLIWEASIFHAAPPLKVCIVAIFVCRLAALGHALADSIPLPQDLRETDYAICDDQHRSYKTTYATLILPKQNHGAALMALAQANGINLLFDSDMEYSDRKAENAFAARTPGYLKSVLDHAESQVSRGIATSLKGMLCSGMMLNFQVSIFMLIRAFDLERYDPNRVQLFSIIVSFLSNLQNYYTCFEYARFYKTAWGDVTEAGITEADLQGILWRFRRRGLFLVLFSSLYALVILYAFVKMVAGWNCGPHAVWQFTGCYLVSELDSIPSEE